MKYIYLMIFLSIFFACSSNDDGDNHNDNPITDKPNSNPGSIKIDDIIFEGKTVTIDWSDAKDEDNDQIFYKLYINSALMTESTQSLAHTTLEYNSDYTGIVIGTDKKGGTTEVNFQFSSPKSKLLFYMDGFGILKALDLYSKEHLWEAQSSFMETHAISENIIYTGINGINGLDILTGELRSTSTPSINYNNQYRNILLDDTNIYAFDGDSNLHCVNRITGGKLWEHSFLDYYAPLTMDSEKVFVCSRNDDFLYAINKETGLTDWSYGLDLNNTGAALRIDTNPLIVNDNIYFGDNIGRFYSVDKNTGVKNWSISTSGQSNTFYPSPTQFNDAIIIGTYSTLYAYNLNNGSSIWEYTPTNGTLETSPFVYNDKVYIGVSKNGSGELLCLNAINGSVIWRFHLENDTTSSPIVFENVVYIGDWNKNLYALNSDTGILEWKIKTEDNIIKSPTIALGEGETVIYPSVYGLKN